LSYFFIREGQLIVQVISHLDNFANLGFPSQPLNNSTINVSTSFVSVCISPASAALDRYPRGFSGHVAHPSRSIPLFRVSTVPFSTFFIHLSVFSFSFRG
jgi:hypothetical protein